MKKFLIVGAGLLAAALAFAPASAKDKTNVKSTTIETNSSVDNYNGYRSFAGAEHGGLISTKTSGNALGVGIGINAATANSNVQGVGGVISGNLGNTGAGIAGSIQSGSANTSAVSGSGALAGSVGNGSSRVQSGGYSLGSAGVRNEWGTSVTNGVTSTTTRTRSVN